MADAQRDENRVTTLICASSDDGTTPVLVKASSNYIMTDDNTTGTDHGTTNAVRDDNHIPVLLAVSSTDGTTPVEVYADPATGKLLIDSS